MSRVALATSINGMNNAEQNPEQASDTVDLEREKLEQEIEALKRTC